MRLDPPLKPKYLTLYQHIFVLMLSAIIFFFQGPSFIYHFKDRLPDLGDSFINSWILAWNAHALLKPEVSVWDAPIFFPVKNALTFSENMFANLWITLPIQHLTDNPVTASNLLLMLSFVLCAYCVYLLVRDVTNNFWAALIAGLVFSFNPYRWSHLEHLQILPIFWSPLALIFANRFIAKLNYFNFFGMLICTWIQYYTSVYLGTMLLVFLVTVFLVHIVVERKGRDRWIYLTRSNLRLLVSVGLFLSIIILMPLGLPYLKTANKWGFQREMSDNPTHSAEILSFFFRPPHAFENYDWLHSIHPRKIRSGEAAVFIGLTPWLLALTTLVTIKRDRADISFKQRQIVRRYAWVAIVIGILILGPVLILFNKETKIPLPYQLVYYLIPGAHAVRVPARFAQLFLLCLVIIGSFSIVNIMKMMKRRSPIVKVALIAAFFLLLCVDYAVRDNPGFLVEPKEKFPAVYKYLAESDEKNPLLELPLGHTTKSQWYSFRYLHYQTLHWRPVIGGRSGWVTPGCRFLSNQLDHSVSTEAFQLISLTPASTLVVHLNHYSKSLAASWKQADLSSFGFKYLGQFGDSLVWERDQYTEKLSDKLTIAWIHSNRKKKKGVRFTLYLTPADPAHHWQYLQQGLSDLSIVQLSVNGTRHIEEQKYNVPPYILADNIAVVPLHRLKIEDGTNRVRFRGPLLNDHLLNIESEEEVPHFLFSNNGVQVGIDESAGKQLALNRNKTLEKDVFYIIPIGKKYVAVKSHLGDFVGISGRKDGDLIADREYARERELFEMIKIRDGEVALKASNRKYVSAEGDILHATETTIGEAEVFKVIKAN